MSAKNLQHIKNRIAPPFHKILMVLILFLSSIVSTPILVGGSYSNTSSINAPLSTVDEQLFLFQEKMNVIVGKADSVIASLELNGGLVRTPIDLSRSELSYVSQIDCVVVNQSAFSTIWTNPLWKYPDGLVIKVTLRTQDSERVRQIYQFLNNVVLQFYNVSMGIFNIHNPNPIETILYLVSPITYSQALIIFDAIFKADYEEENGNSVGIIESMITNSPTIYAFGFSMVKRFGIITKIIRSAVVAQENKIQVIGNQRLFNLSLALNSPLIPNANALVSKFSFMLPFMANVTRVSPKPDNIGGSFTGYFEWVLKHSTTSIYDSFDAEVVYLPFSSEDFFFTRVSVSASYSDFLLENNGILNMTYDVKNTGTDEAYNTSIFFPIPEEVQLFINEGLEIPVLRDDLLVDEVFNSSITLDIHYFSYVFEILILDIQGWYENVTTLSLERWLDNSTLEINEYVSIETTNGISEDLYNAVIGRIMPILDANNILNITMYYSTFEPIITEQLQFAVEDAYNIVFNEFYENKTIFQFSSPDFHNEANIFGGYIECTIPELEVNETKEVYWSITDIPTSADKFGAFTILPANGVEDHAIFRTTESDYKTLMLSIFIGLNSAGRFLSVYETITDSFISIGCRYQYFDSKGRDYYGLTNGLNLQLGDDEAVLESILNTNRTTYRVGESIQFTLDINNLGTIGAYDIHIDIVNLKLNYLWLPTDLLLVKSFDIDTIAANESVNQEFSIEANSYIGLNTYVAIISFISDYNQPAEEIYIPWTDTAVPWTHSGETTNIITSTLTFGILFPPISLENAFRPSFPVPEIEVLSDYTLSESNRSMYVKYEIENKGLSASDVEIMQIFGMDYATFDDINCTLVLETGDEQTLTPTIIEKEDFYNINYASTTLQPGDKIIVEINLSNLAEDFIVPPILVNYSSIYEIHSTDFQSSEEEYGFETIDSMDLSIRSSPANVSESEQTEFLWFSFSSVIKINLPFSGKYDEILFSSLPWIYTVISTGVLSGVIAIVIIVSRMRK